jgi:hypothetical protein
MDRKKSKNLTWDPKTLFHAYLLANVFHGSNISALVTNLVNEEYIAKKDIFTQEDINIAQNDVNLFMNGNLNGKRSKIPKNNSTKNVSSNDNKNVGASKNEIVIDTLTKEINTDNETPKLSDNMLDRVNGILGDDNE